MVLHNIIRNDLHDIIHSVLHYIIYNDLHSMIHSVLRNIVHNELHNIIHIVSYIIFYIITVFYTILTVQNISEYSILFSTYT